MTGDASTCRILWRGFRKRCPRCGREPIFTRWYTPREACSQCRLRLETGNGDTWAFMYVTTAGLTGLIIVAMLIISPTRFGLAQMLLVLAAVVVIVGTLPRRKGLAIAFEYLLDRRTARFTEPAPAPEPAKTKQEVGSS